MIQRPSTLEWETHWAWCVLWISAYTILAAGLLMATSATFDRSLGRAATHTILGTPVTGTRPARRPRRPAVAASPLPPG